MTSRQGRRVGACPAPWTADDPRWVRAPTLPVIGDTDFVTVEHAAAVQRLIPRAQSAVLPATTHMALLRRTSLLLPLVSGLVSGVSAGAGGRSSGLL